MKRREAREKAIQTLYQIEIAKIEWKEALANVLDGKEADSFLHNTIAGVMEHLEEIDKLISSHLHNWRLERLAHIDRAILRLAVYELRFDQIEHTPPQVVINEAVELAKRFSTAESSRFINGVLSTVLKQGEHEDGSARD